MIEGRVENKKKKNPKKEGISNEQTNQRNIMQKDTNDQPEAKESIHLFSGLDWR